MKFTLTPLLGKVLACLRLFDVECGCEQGYMAEIDDAELQHLVPAVLRTNRDILFTNITEIHEFHARQVVLR